MDPGHRPLPRKVTVPAASTPPTSASAFFSKSEQSVKSAVEFPSPTSNPLNGAPKRATPPQQSTLLLNRTTLLTIANTPSHPAGPARETDGASSGNFTVTGSTRKNANGRKVIQWVSH